MPKIDGPKVTTTYSCFDCRFNETESYKCQSDSGHDVYCTHSLAQIDGAKRRRIGDTTWDTPAWCPFRGSGVVPE